MSVVSGIYDLIKASPEITGQLGKYKMDGAKVKRPAIFTMEPAPKDAKTILITIVQVGGSSPASLRDRSTRAYRVNVDVKVWGVKNQSQKKIRDLADDLLLLLDRAEFDDAKFCILNCVCEPPVFVNDPDGFPGYSVLCDVQIIAKEN